jgi:hypothetical protein
MLPGNQTRDQVFAAVAARLVRVQTGSVTAPEDNVLPQRQLTSFLSPSLIVQGWSRRPDGMSCNRHANLNLL